MGYVVWGVAVRWSSFTGGDNGVTNVPFPAVGGMGIQSHTQYYYLVLLVVLLCAWGYHRLINSPFGLGLRGIKGSETRMRSLGYRTGRASVRGLRAFGGTGQPGRRALRLLQPLREPGGLVLPHLGGSRADGPSSAARAASSGPSSAPASCWACATGVRVLSRCTTR